jgi:hypothetical protein
MPDPIPLRAGVTRTGVPQAANTSPTPYLGLARNLGSTKALGTARGLGSPRPPAYRREQVPPLRWHARWPRPHPLAWALFGCVAFWWTVICAARF